jgi:Na+-driven multidrug efflux pump
LASAALLSISNIIFSAWVGSNISIPVELSIAMTIYVIAICWMTIHCYYINAIGKMKLQMYLYFISVIINIPLAVVFSRELGLVGVALSNILVVIVMGEMLRIQCNKVINKTASGIWSS